jgi:L-ascorbate metabolism protein UlaG (beta-lactamase superfamily)
LSIGTEEASQIDPRRTIWSTFTESAIMTYLGHATILLEIDGVRILTDPLLRRRTLHLRRPSIEQPRLFVEGIDAVVISHMHWDHLDLPSLRMLPPETPVIAPKGSRALLHRAGLLNIVEVRPGDEFHISHLRTLVTPANHSGFRPPFGPDGECVGFVFHGSQSVYFAGDTDLFPEMVDVGRQLDIALLPVWGWGPTLGNGHLDPARAAEALTALQPSLAVPIHWGTLCPIGLKWARPTFLTEPPREFVHEAYMRAPDVEVRIVQPGGRLDMRRDRP